MDDEFDWEELDKLGEEILSSNVEDKEFYGARHNEYNPQIHIGCVIEGCETLEELVYTLSELASMLDDLDSVGWELSEPVTQGLVYTEWKGVGPPPPEYSMFDKDGNDLDGNHVSDLYDFNGEDDD